MGLLALGALTAFAEDGGSPAAPPPTPATSPVQEAAAPPPAPEEGPASSAPEEGPASSATEEALEKRLELVEGEQSPPSVPSRLSSPPIASALPLPREKDLLAQAHKSMGRYVIGQGASEEPLTLDAPLQDQLDQILKNYDVPFGAVVALDPSTGRVLAMAEHSRVRPDLRGLATRALFPAASIFKIVTAAALLAEGIGPDVSECFHGGKRRLDQKLLVDSQQDGLCYSLATALARSANVVFAKLTLKHLTAPRLRSVAAALGFNRPLPFAMPTGVSLAAIPDDPFGLATAGAGFGDVFLSPLHGAALAATVANGGIWKQPVLLERELGAASPGEQVLTKEQALALTDMMEQTVTQGTAARIFHERGHQVKGAVGKTGSLADKSPFRDYSWFVGFAPRDNPKVAVAAVIVNDPLWRIRATWLGREAMRLYLEAQAHKAPAPAAPAAASPEASPPPLRSAGSAPSR